MAKLASTNLKQFGLVLCGKGLHEKLNREKAPAFADTPCTQSAANFLRGRFFFADAGPCRAIQEYLLPLHFGMHSFAVRRV